MIPFDVRLWQLGFRISWIKRASVSYVRYEALTPKESRQFRSRLRSVLSATERGRLGVAAGRDRKGSIKGWPELI